MGANGQHASGILEQEESRRWMTVGKIGDDIRILQMKPVPGKKVALKLPEESHTKNRVYAIMEKDGSDVKAIARYGSDGKKLWEIHTQAHKDLGEHVHKWTDAKPDEPMPLTESMKELLEKIRRYDS